MSDPDGDRPKPLETRRRRRFRVAVLVIVVSSVAGWLSVVFLSRLTTAELELVGYWRRFDYGNQAIRDEFLREDRVVLVRNRGDSQYRMTDCRWRIENGQLCFATESALDEFAERSSIYMTQMWKHLDSPQLARQAIARSIQFRDRRLRRMGFLSLRDHISPLKVLSSGHVKHGRHRLRRIESETSPIPAPAGRAK